MKIALVGYGKMGKEIEQMAISRGHEIVFKTSVGLTSETVAIKEADVAIEFSRPDAAVNNILLCIQFGVPVVIGTTGWYNRLDEVKIETNSNKGAILYSTNFSIGVNVLFHMNKMLASIMDKLDEYTPSMKEIHHVHKLDKPSGTAITIAEGIIDEIARLDSWAIDHEKEANDVLNIDVERTDEVPGTHTIKYESEIDIIEMTHIAKNRKGFALGAVKAAEWLVGKQGVYTMKDFLKF
ncbi:MAG: 4-hydroxy-tetrahydrodipicolinate reductase [Flavobacteriales bacterium]